MAAAEAAPAAPEAAPEEAVPMPAQPPLFAKLRLEDYTLPDDVTRDLLSPSLVVHLDKVRRNVDKLVELCGSRWCPHLKTTKLPEVWEVLLSKGIRRFKCTTTREASVFLNVASRLGVRGVLLIVAYPVSAPGLRCLSELAATSSDAVRFAVLREDAASCAEVPENLGVYADVNVGMNRTGLRIVGVDGGAPGWRDELLAMANALGPRFLGLHAYEGHLGASDTDACDVAYQAVADAAQSLRSAGREVLHVITSGSETFAYALQHPRLKEFPDHSVSPGIPIFHDFGSELLKPHTRGLEPAAVVLSRVVSLPAPGIVTVEAGAKSVDAASGDPCCFALGRQGWEPLHPSEEHMKIRIPDGATPPKRGEVVWLITRHICCSINLAETALLVDRDSHGNVTCRPAAVSARAHDLFVRRRSAEASATPEAGIGSLPKRPREA
eukprot:NODE_6258_length_1687_cov_10.746154.p1 GENE.NODE_6258_length_1687_cov_10.746154~~NODE_6258_length_1687_cov_10.746154.p1  ORF type:complete len:439 (+),score=110.77 NODE_6258_length_1687_cov_10.746154:101-1417(+)